MAPIDPKDIDNSVEDCARQLDQFVSTANSFHVKGDGKYTRFVECIVFMITNGRFPATQEMTTELGSRRNKRTRRIFLLFRITHKACVSLIDIVSSADCRRQQQEQWVGSAESSHCIQSTRFNRFESFGIATLVQLRYNIVRKEGSTWNGSTYRCHSMQTRRFIPSCVLSGTAASTEICEGT